MPDKKPHCSAPEVLYRFKSKNKKNIKVQKLENSNKNKAQLKIYEVDERTDLIASPKLMILKETTKTQENLLDKFLLKNSLHIDDLKKESLEDSEEKTSRDSSEKIEKYQTSNEKKKMKERRNLELERARKEHKKLIDRKNHLRKLIEEQTKRIKLSQVNNA